MHAYYSPPPTENLHLRNVTSGHAHEQQNGVLHKAKWLDQLTNSRLGYFWVMKNWYRGPAHYKIELIYVLTKVRSWGGIKLDRLIKKKERTIFATAGLHLYDTLVLLDGKAVEDEV